jgi:peptidoglycan biosynthesis protein MviN/MurJ (putative lipid II flippase)
MIPVILLTGFSNFITSVLNARHLYSVTVFYQLFGSIVSILFIVFGYNYLGVYSLALGLSFGWFISLFFIIPVYRKSGIKYKFKEGFYFIEIKKVNCFYLLFFYLCFFYGL